MNPSIDERGSATSEFVLIALPLILPALLFFLSISQVSRAEMEASMLAREAIKAFVSSENDAEAHLRTRLLLDQYSQLVASGRNTSSSFNSLSDQYSISCSTYPCIQPGAQVQLTLFSFIDVESEISGIEQTPGNTWGVDGNQVEKRRVAIASARGYVDKWS
jgi:Flp pilus assembly protein TadG